jgi:catechol 2,3-dioxygenase-like lactoylglutathione lyase family enzyme
LRRGAIFGTFTVLAVGTAIVRATISRGALQWEDRKHGNHSQAPQPSASYRQFYEEVIGLPLIATWSEADELFGKVRTYCHCFFGLADGGALAFFQFADKDDERTFSPPIAETPFHHIALKVDQATQEEIEQRIQAAGYTAPDTFVLEHGYCRSVYITDPNGMLLEFTLDAPNAEQIAQERQADAHATLQRWLRGDHTSNNVYR